MNTTQKGLLAVITCIFVWGNTFVSTKVLLGIFSPVEILFIRFCIGFVALCVLAPKFFTFQGKKREGLMALCGLLGVTLYFLMENSALYFTQASNVGVIMPSSPLFVALISYFFFHKKTLTPQFFLGFFLAMAGIFLISFGSRALDVNPLGDLLAVAATIVWALYTIAMQKLSQFGYSTLLMTRRVFLYGIIFILPAMYLTGGSVDMERILTPIALGNLLFLGVLASAICYVEWNFAVKALGAFKTSMFIYCVPVITVLSALIILDEKISGASWIGIVLTLSGLFLSQRYTGKQPETAEAS